jgi:hypothetical protein
MNGGFQTGFVVNRELCGAAGRADDPRMVKVTCQRWTSPAAA